MEQVSFYIGQAFGVVAIVLGFVSYQLRTRQQLMFAHTATVISFCVHYLLIGAMPGLALNIVALIRNTVYHFAEKNGKIHRGWAILFAAAAGIAGALSWQGWYSIFIVVGLIINSYCLSFSDPQNIRKSILVSCPLVLIYDCFVFSVSGGIYESIATISAAIGIYRNRKSK